MLNPTQQLNPPCPKCHRKSTTRRGKRRTYPLILILDAVSTFNLGYSITDTRSLLRRRFHVDVPDRTINSWLTTYRSAASYSRLRTAGKKLFDPRLIIVSRFFE